MKKIFTIKEMDLRRIIKESIKKVLKEGCLALPLQQEEGRNVLNEMARLNKRDDSTSPFPSNRFRVWVQGDNSPHKPAHMHISYAQEGWEIKVFIENGEFWEAVKYGQRKRRDEFIDVIQLVKKWFKLPTTMPGRVGTNQDAAQNEWDACNDD